MKGVVCQQNRKNYFKYKLWIFFIISGTYVFEIKLKSNFWILKWIFFVLIMPNMILEKNLWKHDFFSLNKFLLAISSYMHVYCSLCIVHKDSIKCNQFYQSKSVIEVCFVNNRAYKKTGVNCVSQISLRWFIKTIIWIAVLCFHPVVSVAPHCSLIWAWRILYSSAGRPVYLCTLS